MVRLEQMVHTVPKKDRVTKEEEASFFSALTTICDVLVQKMDLKRFVGSTPMDPAFLFAGAVSHKSNGHTMGFIHRDELDLNEAGNYVVFIALPKLTTTNGSVRIWTESTQYPIDEKNGPRAVKDEKYTDLELTESEAAVFDARLLHRGLPNKTSENTMKLVFHLASPGYRQRKHYCEKQ
jgi:ectoine hydroxylase-related dioxygenase (phytanoyl-CoA dioxygenase family)